MLVSMVRMSAVALPISASPTTPFMAKMPSPTRMPMMASTRIISMRVKPWRSRWRRRAVMLYEVVIVRRRSGLMEGGNRKADLVGLVQAFDGVEDDGDHEVGHHADHTGHHEDDHRLHRRRHFLKRTAQVIRATVRGAPQRPWQIARVLAQADHFKQIDRN